MENFYLGVDIGSSKSHVLISGESGNVLGFGSGGPANPDNVGHAGMLKVMENTIGQAAEQAGLTIKNISGAGFGISGFDWPQSKPDLLNTIAKLGLAAPVEVVNDAVLGLMAGADEGWGIAVVSGTGCNAWGWNRDRSKVGHVTGGGIEMGELGGAAELVFMAVQAVSHAWSLRGPETSLTSLFISSTGAQDLDDLLFGLMSNKYHLTADAAPLVFKAAHEGDPVALNLVYLAGKELGEMANSVIRQLNIADEDFDIVQIGSMFNGGQWLTDSMIETVHKYAPGVRFIRLDVPPVVGALFLGAEAAGKPPSLTYKSKIREYFLKND
ncbi:MAG: hypothetical protein JEZ06_10805 [Anaerolineaceae bacterium]|nr:hypothetical protein [Anaerolineaceae bacterium]